MPKTKISEFSATPANNTDIDSINIAEGCAPSGINDAIRELMAQLKDFQTGAVGDSFNGPIGTTTAAAGAFTTLSASSTATLSGLTASTALALDASKNIVSVTNTGTGSNVLATSPTLVTPILGTPTSATLTNATGLPIATGVSGLGTGIATALAVNTGSAGAPVLFNGALGTPSSGTVTNLTGTASININGTVGATTATTGAFTTVAASGAVTLSGGTANGVTYLNSSKVLTSGSALVFDGASLGIGTSSPSFALDVATASARIRVAPSTTTNAALFQATNAGGSAYIGLDNSTGSTLTSQYALNIYHNGNYPIVFSQNATERMRLTSTGLGIGTSNPQRKIDAQSTTADYQLRLGYNASFYYDIGRVNSNGYLGFYGSQTGATGFTFGGVDGTWATISSTGNLGLGVTPNTWTDLVPAFQLGNAFLCAFGANPYSAQGANAYYNSGWKYRTTAAASVYQQNGGEHSWSSAASGTAGNAITFTQAMTLAADGNLAVGTTTTTNARFYVEGVSASSTPTIATFTGGFSSAVTSFSALAGLQLFSYQSVSGPPYTKTSAIIANSDGTVPSQLQFWTKTDGQSSPALRATIDSSGNFGIGTSSPQARLQVLDQIKVSSADQSSGNVILGDGSSTAFNVGIGRWNGSTNAAGTGGVGYFSQGVGNSGGHYFYTGDAAAGSQTERARIPPAGGFQSVTTISVGNATPSASGAGITFPATQSASSNANTLDDYEEGTWSSSAITTSNVTGASFYNGYYTKIGNLVHVQGTFTLTVTTANTLTYVVMALPLAPQITTTGSIIDNVSLVAGTAQAATNGSAYAFFAASASLPSGATDWYVSYEYQV